MPKLIDALMAMLRPTISWNIMNSPSDGSVRINAIAMLTQLPLMRMSGGNWSRRWCWNLNGYFDELTIVFQNEFNINIDTSKRAINIIINLKN
jgi:hypothetical protein